MNKSLNGITITSLKKDKFQAIISNLKDIPGNFICEIELSKQTYPLKMLFYEEDYSKDVVEKIKEQGKDLTHNDIPFLFETLIKLLNE